MLIKPFYIVTTEKLGGLRVKGISEILWPYPSLQPSHCTPRASLGWEDALEKEMAHRSSILDWKIPWKEEPGRLQSTGSQRV